MIHAYGYDTKGNKGVSFGLDAVQVTRAGERLGGGAAAVGMFDALPDDGNTDASPSEGVAADDIFA